MDYTKLYHDREAFQRETYSERMKLYGFKNMARLELFLWDLELFLQIQELLGTRVVLKGGAATQFYLPREAQRTSVDIDMIFSGTKDEVDTALREIEEKLSTENLLKFREHIPKNPKTNLPMYTFYTDIPSVLTDKERNVTDTGSGVQELKIEFIMESEACDFIRRTGENIFAVNSKWEYQILPVSSLFADKLTTIGNETIGVQNDRMDEQVKQFYDVMMLTKYCLDDLDAGVVCEKYRKRAEQEWHDRRPGEEYHIENVVADVRRQLYRYSMADSGEDMELKKHINDFKGLYLNSKVEFTPQSVACGAAMLRLMYELLLREQDWHMVKRALDMEKKLVLDQYEGREKGDKIKELRAKLIQEFGSYSAITPEILKGKNLKRVFWAVADADNLDEIEKILSNL
ncbi:MAG: nucleotidyl transferase AbiEii/AbiGii toxin family protein [Blautia sp.]|nr:nucleotidyl transferase AbiEii/AbiGii toxin family protein [Blautia sp.]